MVYRTLVLVGIAVCFTLILLAEEPKATPWSQGSSYLFVWAGDAAHQSTDFLAVIDANPSSPSYAHIVNSVPVGATGTMPHHTEYEFPRGNMLIANGFVAGRTFLFVSYAQPRRENDSHNPAKRNNYPCG